MGEIYAQSILTIIAVAGDNPNHGLTGCLQRLAKPISVRSRGLNPIGLPPSIESEISRSVWSSRGWTYQAGLLARRRLLFTDSQMYFQCAGMYCEESLSVPLKPFHVKNLSKIPDTHKGLFPRSGIGKTSEEILSWVAKYAQ